MSLTPPQQKVIDLLNDGYRIFWNRSGEYDGVAPACAAWKGGAFWRIHPLTLRAMVKQGRLSVEGGNWFFEYRLKEPD